MEKLINIFAGLEKEKREMYYSFMNEMIYALIDEEETQREKLIPRGERYDVMYICEELKKIIIGTYPYEIFPDYQNIDKAISIQGIEEAFKSLESAFFNTMYYRNPKLSQPTREEFLVSEISRIIKDSM